MIYVCRLCPVRRIAVRSVYCERLGKNSLPVRTSHMRTLSSKLPETIRLLWGLKLQQNTQLLCPFKVFKHLPELSSHTLSVLSSLALTNSRLSLDQATSLMPNLCPEIVFSNLPSYAPQILINLSAAGNTEFNL